MGHVYVVQANRVLAEHAELELERMMMDDIEKQEGENVRKQKRSAKKIPKRQ